MPAPLRLEPYEASRHYDLVAAWWKARGDECLPADVLPPTGAVAYHNDRCVAACIVWLTNAATAHLAFPITAPLLSPRIAYRAIAMVIEGAVDVARRAGCKMIWASAENRGVDRILTSRIGFKRTTPLNSYFRFLEGGISHDILVGTDFDAQQKGFTP